MIHQLKNNNNNNDNNNNNNKINNNDVPMLNQQRDNNITNNIKYQKYRILIIMQERDVTFIKATSLPKGHRTH